MKSYKDQKLKLARFLPWYKTYFTSANKFWWCRLKHQINLLCFKVLSSIRSTLTCINFLIFFKTKMSSLPTLFATERLIYSLFTTYTLMYSVTIFFTNIFSTHWKKTRKNGLIDYILRNYIFFGTVYNIGTAKCRLLIKLFI